MIQTTPNTQHAKDQPILMAHRTKTTQLRINAIQTRANEFGMALALPTYFNDNSPMRQHIELDIAVMTIVEESD